MDIFNRPPTIAEDTLQYTLYPPQDAADKASVSTFATVIHAFVDELLPNFIWHRDAFQLKIVADPDAERESGQDESYMLDGRMRVGDCVDDEWYVVWLLREISARWDIAISVFDSDGEFLLIEAADALPDWVRPTNAENRVWIYRSHLHLIPLSHTTPPSRRRSRRRQIHEDQEDDIGLKNDEEDEEYINVADAISALRLSRDTRAPDEIEALVWQRISGYPTAAAQHTHTSNMHIPVDIARALSVDPSLAQKAVETFYTRDAIQLRAAHRMSRFPPQPSVLASVKLTRTAYAQLMGQKFYPPKIFGRWSEREGTKEWKWRDLGMKLACGFEMTFQDSKARHSLAKTAKEVKSSNDALKEALKRNPDYETYITNLVSADYFKGEARGSALWNTLEDKAAQVFVEARQTDDSTRLSFASLVNNAIARGPSVEDLLEPSQPPAEESDEWINVDPNNFDEMLERTIGSSAQSKASTLSKPDSKQKGEDAMDVDASTKDQNMDAEDRMASEQASRLQGLAAKVEKFVEGQGTLEGAQFDDEASLSDGESLDEFSDDNDSIDSDDEGEGGGQPSWEADDQARREAMDKLVPALDASEYGRMPATYYRHSQPVASEPNPLLTADNASESPNGESRSAKNISGDDGTESAGNEAGSGKALGGTVPPQQGQTKPKLMRRPLFPRDQFDGVVDSDDETDPEDELGGARLGEDEESEEEDRPVLVMPEGAEDALDVDMDAEEEEFLEFSRKALGISDEDWQGIIAERRERGAFVPATLGPGKTKKTTNDDAHGNHPKPGKAGGMMVKTTDATTTNPMAQPGPTSTSISSESSSKARNPSEPEPGPHVDESLNSFEAVMQAMDAELARQSSLRKAGAKKPFGPEPPPSSPAAPPAANSGTKKNQKENTVAANKTAAASSKGKGKAKAAPTVRFAEYQSDSDMDEDGDGDVDGDGDIEATMEAELQAILERGGALGDNDDDDVDLSTGAGMDYNLIKNFLESFKSQGGLAGPVGSLVGRLEKGWQLPRDES